MSIEFAFVLDVLVGQLLLMWASWRAFIKLIKAMGAQESGSGYPPVSRQVIALSPETMEKDDELWRSCVRGNEGFFYGFGWAAKNSQMVVEVDHRSGCAQSCPSPSSVYSSTAVPDLQEE